VFDPVALLATAHISCSVMFH